MNDLLRSFHDRFENSYGNFKKTCAEIYSSKRSGTVILGDFQGLKFYFKLWRADEKSSKDEGRTGDVSEARET